VNKNLVLLTLVLLLCLGVLSPATAIAQNRSRCSDISAAISGDTTLQQLSDLLLTCGKLPAINAAPLRWFTKPHSATPTSSPLNPWSRGGQFATGYELA
jgi:hypothetical protein